MNIVTMELLRLFTITLLLSVCSIFCFPSRPLNERSKELAWQAWLLVDDQNQNKQNEPEMYMRRRITPKSVFIAPTFSPDKLPACAEGYQSDIMGRCIQIIKIDQEKHLSFLLERLNAQFGDLAPEDEEDVVEENLSTPGPFQLNIPLKHNEETEEEPYYANPDIAIIVAPTNGDYDNAKVKRTDDRSTNKIDDHRRNGPRTDNDDESETTTMSESTTLETTTQSEQTNPTETTLTADETTLTEAYTTTVQDNTESTIPTSTEMMHALFFWDNGDSNSSLKNQTSGANADLPTPNEPEGALIGNRMKLDAASEELITSTSDRNGDNEQTTFKVPNLELPVGQDTKQSQTRHTTNLLQPPPSGFHSYQHLPSLNQRVQFNAEDPMENDGIAPAKKSSSQIEFESLFQDYILNRNPDLKSSERHIFKNRKLFNDRDADSILDPDNLKPFESNNHRLAHQQQQAGPVVYNHRNRDKHLWNIPSDWVDINPNKPIVLKFANSRQVNENIQRQKAEGIYREVPPEELSYIFGSKRLPRSFR